MTLILNSITNVRVNLHLTKYQTGIEESHWWVFQIILGKEHVNSN